MTGPGPHALRWRGWRPSWQALRVALIGAWYVWVVLAWWSGPRPATVERAQGDIAAGKVAVYQWGESWERPTVSSWGSMPTLRPSESGALFVWRTHDWRMYYVVLDGGYVQTDYIFPLDLDSRRSPEAEAIRTAVMSSLLATGRPLAGIAVPNVGYLATVVGLLCLAVLIAGPAPVIGTRWYWFWIGTFVPLGLEIKALRAARAGAESQPARKPRPAPRVTRGSVR